MKRPPKLVRHANITAGRSSLALTVKLLYRRKRRGIQLLRKTTIERQYWLSREKAAIKMAYFADSIRSRRLHLDLAARLSLKAETLNPVRAVVAPAVRLLRPMGKAIPRLLRLPPKPPKPLVLICDEEELTLDLLEHHLSNAGYEVMRASDGEDALRCLAERTPAVVILAVMIPLVSGIEVLQRIRENPTQRNLPVMMLTHRDAEDDVVEALRLGASDYMTKPFLIGEVLERVSKHITPYEHPLDSLLEELAA